MNRPITTINPPLRCLETRARGLDVIADDADWAGAADTARAIRRVASDMRARARSEARYEPSF